MYWAFATALTRPYRLGQRSPEVVTSVSDGLSRKANQVTNHCATASDPATKIPASARRCRR